MVIFSVFQNRTKIARRVFSTFSSDGGGLNVFQFSRVFTPSIIVISTRKIHVAASWHSSTSLMSKNAYLSMLEKCILDPSPDPNASQNLIDSSLSQKNHEVVHYFLSNFVHRQTDRQTNNSTSENITSFLRRGNKHARRNCRLPRLLVGC